MPQVIIQQDEPGRFPSSHWVAVPASDGRWMIVLTGVAIVDFKGQTPADWRRDSIYLRLDLQGAFQTAGYPPRVGYHVAFAVEQWAPFATVNAIYDAGPSDNAGFAVDVVRFRAPNEIQIDVAARDSDAWLFRIGYQLTTLGKISYASGAPL